MKEGNYCVGMDSGVIHSLKLDSWPAVWGTTRWRYDRSSQSLWTWAEAVTIPMRGGSRCSLMMATQPWVSSRVTNAEWFTSGLSRAVSKRHARCCHLPEGCHFAQPTASVCPGVHRPNPLRVKVLFCPMLPDLRNKKRCFVWWFPSFTRLSLW